MKIIVCVKVIKGEINPFDESALECALRLSDDVTVLSMGPLSCEKVLKPLTRLGAKVTLISDLVYAGSDTLATSYILSKAIDQMEYDLIICGRQSVDGDTAQVGPMLSAMLKKELVTNVLNAEVSDNCLNLITRMGSQNVKTPALITVERSYLLRFPSIFSKESDINILSNKNLCCDEKKCGLSGSPTRVLETYENTSGKRKCKFISYDELPKLIEKLKEKNTKKNIIKNYTDKLNKVWAVGEEVYEKAKEIANNPTLIEKLPPKIIADMAKKEQPDVILWNADLWGRSNAPYVAALLDTGLCADCTWLETDGEELYMIRPASSGSITAKIKCVKTPKMATVRNKMPSSDIIVSGGKGVLGKMDKLKEFADKINGEIGASRGLVDLNCAPYEMQIGLTGKTVSPKIYIAIGISGAIHHTCAVESAETIIAINPDKDARIFEYADYGILEEF